jgi:hypothetical protein
MKTLIHDEYKASARVVLRPGDRFRATAGPYWRTGDGQKIPLRAYGPFVFRQYMTKGKVGWIVADDRDGDPCILHVTGRRKGFDPSLVTRPYKIKGRVRGKQNRKALRCRGLDKTARKKPASK